MCPVRRMDETKIYLIDPVWKGVINLYFLFQGDRNMYVYDECARCHELLPIQIPEFVQ